MEGQIERQRQREREREEYVPAGSLRCERFVKSSLASSMVGFINGGREGSPFWRASTANSRVLVCRREEHGQRQRYGWMDVPRGRVSWQRQQHRGFLISKRTSPFSNWKTSDALSPLTVLLTTSEATQPSVASGCHALVPTS